MHDHNAQIISSQRARRLHEIILTYLEHLPANKARVTNPTNDAEGENQFIKPTAEKRDERNCQQKTGKGQKDIEDVARNEAINPPAIITRQSAKDCSDQRRDEDDDQTNLQRDACAVNDAREDVASRHVRPEPVPGRRRLASFSSIRAVIIFGDHRREDGGEDENADDDESKNG